MYSTIQYKVATMATSIRLALRDTIHTLDWMSPETRRAALAHLADIDVVLFKPDAINDQLYTLASLKVSARSDDHENESI